MSLKLTYRELVDSIPVLSVLANTAMPVFAGATIRRVLDHAREEIEAFEKERLALVSAAADKDENDKPIMRDAENGTKEYVITDPEKRAELDAKYAELMTVIVEIRGTKLKLESFGDVKIPPSFLLPWLVNTDA